MSGRSMALLTLTLVAAVLAYLSGTAAISQVSADRGHSVWVAASDATGSVALSGFAGSSYTLTSRYTGIGTVTNQFGMPMSVRLTIDPLVTQACRRVSGQTCTAGTWTLNYCLATDQRSVGTTTCQVFSGGTRSQVNFTASGASDPASQSTAYLPAAGGGDVLFLMARATMTNQANGHRLCATAAFAADGNGSRGDSFALNVSGAVVRQQTYRYGSGCP